jgi:uncharacterized membrane protein SirB2
MMLILIDSAVPSTPSPVVNLTTISITALATLIATGVAALIGSHLQRNAEHSKWIRDQRAAVYVKYIALVSDAMLMFRNREQGMKEEPPTTAVNELQRMATTINIFGPADAGDAVNALTLVFIGRINDPSLESQYQVAYSDAILAIRRALRVEEPSRNRVRWLRARHWVRTRFRRKQTPAVSANEPTDTPQIR